MQILCYETVVVGTITLTGMRRAAAGSPSMGNLEHRYWEWHCPQHSAPSPGFSIPRDALEGLLEHYGSVPHMGIDLEDGGLITLKSDEGLSVLGEIPYGPRPGHCALCGDLLEIADSRGDLLRQLVDHLQREHLPELG